MNSKSTSQSPSGRNVSPHCDRAGPQCSLTRFLFFTLSPSASSSPSLLASPALPLTGKVKQEPSVYRDGPPYQRRGSLQLWQFLVTLLDDPANGHFIAWTGRGMEFKLIEPEEVSSRFVKLNLRSSVQFFFYVDIGYLGCRFVIHVFCLCMFLAGGSPLGHPEEPTGHEL